MVAGVEVKSYLEIELSMQEGLKDNYVRVLRDWFASDKNTSVERINFVCKLWKDSPIQAYWLKKFPSRENEKSWCGLVVGYSDRVRATERVVMGLEFPDGQRDERYCEPVYPPFEKTWLGEFSHDVVGQTWDRDKEIIKAELRARAMDMDIALENDALEKYFKSYEIERATGKDLLKLAENIGMPCGDTIILS